MFFAIKQHMFYDTEISFMQYSGRNVVVIVNSGDNPTISETRLVTWQMSEIIIEWDPVLILFKTILLA